MTFTLTHELIPPTERLLAEALGDRLGEYGALWHVVQFYMTGEALKQLLRVFDHSRQPLARAPYRVSHHG